MQTCARADGSLWDCCRTLPHVPAASAQANDNNTPRGHPVFRVTGTFSQPDMYCLQDLKMNVLEADIPWTVNFALFKVLLL